MKNLKKRDLFFLFTLPAVLFLFFLYNANLASAAFELNVPEIGDTSGLPQYVAGLFDLAIKIGVGLAVLTVLFGGLYYLVSLGSGGMTSEGKEWIKAGILGLLLVLSSYLILWIVNPELVSLRLSPTFPFVTPTISIPAGPEEAEEIPTITFNEIPIGTLTESLLTRTMDCYDFNEYGEPIDGNPQTAIWEPTFLDHDRVDCILKLGEAVEKKAKVFSELSEEIAKLMERCDCLTIGRCDLNCTTCYYPRPNVSPVQCEPRNLEDTEIPCRGDCVSALCTGTQDPCPAGVIEQIKHGPILLEAEGICGEKCIEKCERDWAERHGRRCDRTCKEECKRQCGKEYKGLDEFKPRRTNISSFVEIEVIIGGRTVKVIKKENWAMLNLIERLMYLREKIEEIKNGLLTDLNLLKRAESTLGKCYLVRSYLDFLKFVEKTDKEKTKIKTEKPFDDPITNQDIDVSKYCKGFNYSNSRCYHTCQKICSPGTNSASFGALKGCNVNNFECLKNAYYKCGANVFGFTIFQNCLTKCKEDCKEQCKKLYPPCEKLDECLQKCDDDSDALYAHEEKCVLNLKELKRCADESGNNFDTFQNCAEKSFACKYCTDQYAGYPDCLKEPVTPGEEYSSVYLYENLSRQKCDECLKKIDVVNRQTGRVEKAECVKLYPETEKCPSCSNCPKCPCKDDNCAKIEKTLLACSADCGEYSYNDDSLTFYCREDWDNDYEEKEFDTKRDCPKEKEIPVGETVDQAEEWAEELIKLITDFAKKLDNPVMPNIPSNPKIGMIQYIKIIGAEPNYCKCISKCDDTEGACQGACVFNQTEVPIYDDQYGYQIGIRWECRCKRRSCSGNPCQKMINLLRGKQAGDKCPKGVEYKGVEWYHQEIKKAFKKLREFIEGESRSEILKKLVYSRKKMDECSAIRKIFKEEVKLLSCGRAEDNAIPPIFYQKVIIKTKPNLLEELWFRCYGRMAGIILKTSDSLLDNWFCCQAMPKL